MVDATGRRRNPCRCVDVSQRELHAVLSASTVVTPPVGLIGGASPPAFWIVHPPIAIQIGKERSIQRTGSLTPAAGRHKKIGIVSHWSIVGVSDVEFHASAAYPLKVLNPERIPIGWQIFPEIPCDPPIGAEMQLVADVDHATVVALTPQVVIRGVSDDQISPPTNSKVLISPVTAPSCSSIGIIDLCDLTAHIRYSTRKVWHAGRLSKVEHLFVESRYCLTGRILFGIDCRLGLDVAFGTRKSPGSRVWHTLFIDAAHHIVATIAIGRWANTSSVFLVDVFVVVVGVIVLVCVGCDLALSEIAMHQ